MKKFKTFFMLLVLFISLSSVYADGNFTSLQTEIDNAGDNIELNQDYMYVNESDYELNEGISINKSNFIVNGNGHTIDASGQSRIFNAYGDNITFLNLNLINGNINDYGGAIFGFNMTLDNVIFYNNSAGSGGALSGERINLNNCTFKSNYANDGAAIFAGSTTTITNSDFMDSYDIRSSLIYGSFDTVLLIENCTFSNSTAKYAPALYNINSTRIRNSIFKNLNSYESAGAVALKGMGQAIIENCFFINITATKNGGALLLDVFGSDGDDGEVFIINTTFIGSSGDYGGALMQLGGNLTLINSNFIENTAVYDGSAVYASSAFINIINNTFISNNILYDSDEGAALYIDNTFLDISDSYLKNNGGNAICTYQTSSNMDNVTFENNTLAIHGVFSTFEFKDLILRNDSLFLNDSFFGSIVREASVDIILINNSIDVINLPTRFDSRDWGWVTPVRNQGDMGACWAFGTCGALESALLKATGIEYDFSENNMQNTMLQYSKAGVWDMFEGGSYKIASQYLISWLGIIPGEYDDYDEYGKISPSLFENETVHVLDLIFIETPENPLDTENIKRGIMECGALTFSYSAKMMEPFYNIETGAQYLNESDYPNHDVCVVGWDDNYSRDNFLITPPGDGAWIIKNSWGEKNGINGYNYISYYDESIFNDSYVMGFIIKNNEKYTTNYQSDLGGDLYFNLSDDDSPISYKINYESVGNDLISAVGTYFYNEGENFTVEIYVNDELKHVQNGSAPYYGFHTVKLTSEIPVKIGDNFTAVMTKNSIPLLYNSRQFYVENSTFLNEGKGWVSLSENETTSLKVYTKDLAIFTENLVKIYKNDSKFEANISMANQTVTFEVNGGVYNRTSDENGTAKIAINLNPGNYTIKTTFNGTAVENTITVLPTLIADNLVKYYRNDSQFYISLIDGEGNHVPYVNITMNINGVFYNRTTNENGTARLNINLNPGEYILTAMDPLTGLQMSYNITVLPVLTAEDINMTYKDGTQFKVNLVDGTGNSVANVNITMNINGVFYNRTTDENGTARLNINLMPGEYIITSQYESAAISNKITIIAKED